MNLEFKLYQVTKVELWDRIKKAEPKAVNDFIIVGGKDKHYKAHHVGNEKGLTLIPGLNIEELALYIAKEDIQLQGNGIYTDTLELDIPQEFLTMDIIENIQRLNK